MVTPVLPLEAPVSMVTVRTVAAPATIELTPVPAAEAAVVLDAPYLVPLDAAAKPDPVAPDAVVVGGGRVGRGRGSRDGGRDERRARAVSVAVSAARRHAASMPCAYNRKMVEMVGSNQ